MRSSYPAASAPRGSAERGPGIVRPAHATPRGQVLVCDDSATMCDFIRLLLAPLYECRVARHAEEALAVLASFRPDVILSDVRMEGLTGYDLCERVRSDPALGNIPFVLMTSGTGEDERAQGLELGADDFLLKPIKPRELLARVASLVRLRRTTQFLETRTRELEASNRRLCEAQTALMQSERLATLGTLAAGVAHEINNPLAYVKSGLDTIGAYIRELQVDGARGAPPVPGAGGRSRPEHVFDELQEITLEVHEGVRRIERIVRDLKEFASNRTEHPEDVDLVREVERAWALAATRSGRRHTLVLDARRPFPVRTVAHKLGQVLLNIFINAIQAIGDRPGEIRVAVSRQHERTCVSISDTGPGIREEHLPRIFDPFFTTKPPGQGTGLGLSVSFAVMQSLGGTIQASSPPGAGATFHLELPGPLPASDLLSSSRL